MSNTLIKKSDTAAMAALIGLLPIFVVILTYGWTNILKNSITLTLDVSYAAELQKALQIIISFFIALVGVILARAIAAEGKRIKIKDPDASYSTRLAYFIVLILISALGTITTGYRIFEEKNIIVEIANSTKEKLYFLKDDMSSKIKTPKYDQDVIAWRQSKENVTKNFERIKDTINTVVSERKKQLANEERELDNLWNDIDREIRNPQAMGIGASTRTLVSKAQAKMPNWQLQNPGIGFNCSNSNLTESEKKKCTERMNSWIETNKQIFDEKKDTFIDSINQCSINEAILKEISELKNDIRTVPDFGKEMNCAVLQTNISEIRQKIENEYENRRPQYTDEEQALIALKTKINADLKIEIDNIDEHLKNAQKISKDESTLILKASWAKYKELRDDAKNKNIEIDASKLPVSIDDAKIDYLGQITRTLELMVERYNKPMTYFIAFLGVIMDLILISFYSRTITIGTSRNNDDGILDTFNG